MTLQESRRGEWGAIFVFNSLSLSSVLLQSWYMMDVLNSSYYKMNKFFLSMVGLWPYISAKNKKYRMFVVNIILALCVLCQVLKIMTSKFNMNLYIEILSNLLLTFVVIIIYVVNCIYEKQVYKLYNHIRFDWIRIDSVEEYEILKKYAKETRTHTIYIIWIWYVSIYSVLVFILLPPLLDIVVPLEEPRPRDILFPVEFLFDTSKYFYISVTILFICLNVMCAASIAAYTAVYMFIQHINALLVLIGYIFENAINTNLDPSMYPDEEGKIYKRLLRGLWFHRRTIKFTNNVNSIYESSFLIEFMIALAVICVDILRILQVQLTLANLQEIVTCSFHIIGNFAWIFVYCYFSQKIMDNSSNLHTKLYNSNWYTCSTKTQKFCYMIAVTSTNFCHISIGKVFVSSKAFYLSFLQTSISYAMVCYSLRK